jgi:glycolate oxidase
VAAVKRAFDPQDELDPGKVIPSLQRCAGYGKLTVLRGLLPCPDLPRFWRRPATPHRSG